MGQYTLGAIGIGHWFERLYEGMLKADTIRLRHAASASGYGKKREQLEKIGITEADYYRINGNEPIPDARCSRALSRSENLNRLPTLPAYLS